MSDLGPTRKTKAIKKRGHFVVSRPRSCLKSQRLRVTRVGGLAVPGRRRLSAYLCENNFVNKNPINVG